MTQEHPITPPPELIQEWWDGTHGAFYEFEAVVTQAARWGADEELEACRLWVSENESIYDAGELVEYRRPRVKTLKEIKEQGMKALLECYAYIPADLYYEIKKTIESLYYEIKKTIESLPDES